MRSFNFILYLFRCSLRSECLNSDTPHHWLPYSGDQCPGIFTVIPNQVQITPNAVSRVSTLMWLHTHTFDVIVFNLCPRSLWIRLLVSRVILDSILWTSYQIRKTAGCACTGNAGNVFPITDFQSKPLVNDPGMHRGTCVTHMPWCMSGSLTRGGGENVPGIPDAYGTRNFIYLARSP